MPLNISKTKLIAFTNKQRIPTLYSLDKGTVGLATTYKYLGINPQSNLSWINHISITLASVNRILGLLKHNLKEAPVHVKKLAYITLLRPKLEYASAIWDPEQTYIYHQ